VVTLTPHTTGSVSKVDMKTLLATLKKLRETPGSGTEPLWVEQAARWRLEMEKKLSSTQDETDSPTKKETL